MRGLTDRRTVLTTAGAAAVAAAAGLVAAQPMEISGAVTFESGAAIPKGVLEIHLEDPVVQDGSGRRLAGTRVESDGGSVAMAFSFSQPLISKASPKLRIVARLEREDGWPIARGGAQVEAASPATLMLKEVVY